MLQAVAKINLRRMETTTSFIPYAVIKQDHHIIVSLTGWHGCMPSVPVYPTLVYFYIVQAGV